METVTTPTDTSLAAERPVPALTEEECRQRRMEWSFLYLLPFGSSTVISLFSLFSGFHYTPLVARAASATPDRFITFAVIQAAAIGMLGCLLHRRGISWATLGWHSPRWRDLLDALLLIAVGYLFSFGFVYALHVGLWYVTGGHYQASAEQQNTAWLTTNGSTDGVPYFRPVFCSRTPHSPCDCRASIYGCSCLSRSSYPLN